jgi:LacI family transcriptional regulator
MGKDMKNYSLKEISDLSGVSIATLSRYFNGQTIRKSNEIKIEDILKKTGYRPNIAARIMKGSSSGVIGLIIPNITHPFFSEITEGIIEEARKNNQLVLVTSSNGSVENEKQDIKQLSNSILDGLIYIPVAKAENIPEIKNFQNIPLVVTARKNIIPNIPHVYHNGEKGGYLATKYLIQMGRKRIAFIASFWEVPCSYKELLKFSNNKESFPFSSIDRFRGYVKALKEAQIEIDKDLLITTGYDYKDGINTASVLDSRLVEFDGVIAMSEGVTEGLSDKLKALGYKIPEDISIIIFDKTINNSNYYTNIELHLKEMGIKSVQMLNKVINTGKSENISLDVELVVNNSTTKKT